MPYLQPLYDLNDARNSFVHLVSVEYDVWTPITEDVEILFTDAGHIIGSACVHLKIREDGKERRISFSGDVGRYTDAILKAPAEFPQAEYILLESTYGNSLHEKGHNNPGFAFTMD